MIKHDHGLKDLIPALGSIAIHEVKRPDVLIPIRRIEARGALCVARECRTWLKELFRYAIATGYIDSSPASDLDIVAAKEPPERHNPMLLQSELKEFLIMFRDFKCAEYAKCAIRILFYTAVRTGELRYDGRLTGHGIRATISTPLNEMEYNEDWIEAQLSHASSSKVRRTYNHAEYVEQRRTMM